MEALSEMSLTMRMLFSSLDEVSTMILRLAPWTARRKRRANSHNLLPIMLLERLLIDGYDFVCPAQKWGWAFIWYGYATLCEERVMQEFAEMNGYRTWLLKILIW